MKSKNRATEHLALHTRMDLGRGIIDQIIRKVKHKSLINHTNKSLYFVFRFRILNYPRFIRYSRFILHEARLLFTLLFKTALAKKNFTFTSFCKHSM